MPNCRSARYIHYVTMTSMSSTRQAAIRRPLATPEEVAEYYGVPVQTLYQWRSRGKGPKSRRIGRHIRYEWDDVEAFEDGPKAVA